MLTFRRVCAVVVVGGFLSVLAACGPPPPTASGIIVSPTPVGLPYNASALLVRGSGLEPGALVSISQVTQRADGGYSGLELSEWVTVGPDGSLPPTSVVVEYAFRTVPTRTTCRIDCSLTVQYVTGPLANTVIRKVAMGFVGNIDDLNYDGIVGCDDLDVLLDSYGDTGDALPADLNLDGAITVLDLSIFLSNYVGPTCD